MPFPRASVKPLINYFIIASSQKKKRSANAREKKARDRERRTKTRVLFVSLVYYEQKRHTERARARRIRKPHHHSSSGLSPTENKHNTRPKKKSASRAQGPLTFLIFHISMFSSWSSPMDAILFSSLSSLFSLFCVRTRERSDVVFLSSRESRPPTCLKKNEKKKFLGPNRHEQKQKKNSEREREKKSAQIPKKALFFRRCPSEGGPLPYLHPFKVPSLCLSVSLSEGR